MTDSSLSAARILIKSWTNRNSCQLTDRASREAGGKEEDRRVEAASNDLSTCDISTISKWEDVTAGMRKQLVSVVLSEDCETVALHDLGSAYQPVVLLC